VDSLYSKSWTTLSATGEAMHNIIHTRLSSEEGLILAGKGLHKKVIAEDEDGNKIEVDNEKKNVYDEIKEELRLKYLEYDRLANPIQLENIIQLWTNDNDADRRYRDNVSDLYSRERPFISRLWEEVTKSNEGKTIICPICEAKPVIELDHYVPREVMPEYSVHVLNLIPLCHECNHTKLAKWLNADGKRIFFNAYFDKVPQVSIIMAAISSIGGNEYPSVKIVVNDDVDMAVEENRIALSTIKELKLIENVYQYKADEVLRERTISIVEHCKYFIQQGKTVEQSIKEELEIEAKIMHHMENPNMIDSLVNEQIIQSETYLDWLVNHLSR